ncbi:PAS domain S-box protein [Sulfuriflexus mobilis]|uniref:PAS domain S-box protein n=1 Tax=Sulfuriflexus mobilis TaxID=1811807 RepID=UPI000F847907|nr:PAS domain S-box protein [Sulfuriflexus mobilis]
MNLSIVKKTILHSILLVLLGSGITAFLFYSKTSTLLVEQALDNFSNAITVEGNRLREHIRSQRENVLFLSHVPPVQGLRRSDKAGGYDEEGKSNEQQWQQRLQSIFRYQLESKPYILTIRYINADGVERVVVGRENGRISVAEQQQLQDKARRTYVRETLKLKQGEIYLSEINLNREHGKITVPHQEVLRIATPVFDELTNELIGMVVTAIDIGKELRLMQKRIQAAGQEITITNDGGGYLLHPDASKTYGFDLGKRYRVQEDIPQMAKLYLPGNLERKKILLPKQTGTQQVAVYTKIPIDPARPERFIAVGISESYDSIVAEHTRVLRDALGWLVVSLLIGVILAVTFSIRLTRPIRQISQAMDDYTHQRQDEVYLPLERQDEVGQLARNFEAMTNEVEETRTRLEVMNRDLETMVDERTAQLQGSENRQRAILNTIADGLITIDDKGLIERLNPAAEKMFGYTADELVGKNISVLLPEEERQAHEAYIDQSELNVPRIINQARDLEGRRKDGTLFPMELNVAPMKIADRRGFVGILRDISERKQAEQALNRFKTTLDETIDCVFMFEPASLKFFYANAGAREQIGYSDDELMNMRAFDIKPDFDEQQFREMIAPMLAGEQTAVNFETVHAHKDGHTVPVEILLQYISPPGEPARFVAIVRDITERKKMDKMKNEFISTVSHELRTPLTSIRGSLGLINGGVTGELSEAAHEMLTIAGNNTERLLLLINDILDIQKIESGQMAFRFQNLALAPFLEQAVEENAAYGREHGIYFEISRSIEAAQVFADRDRLMQVMANLLSNAAKFSPEGETVEINLARHHDLLRISVTDHGPGIPEEFHDKLFERFTQSDSSDSRRKGGTGLGLNISKIIVEKHGGHIGFISREGVGTTLYVDLPVLMGMSPDIDGQVPRQIKCDHRACVLIIEDDPDVAMLLQRMLAESGFNSDIASNADEARKLLSQQRTGQYRAITLDLLLPDENGMSLLTELRKSENTREIPVVVVSVKADESKRNLQGGAMGIVDWLNKPIDQQRLISAVRQAAGPARSARVLHVEDESDVHWLVKTMLQDQCELTWTTTLAASREALATGEFDLVLLDIGLPDGSGLDLLDAIEQHLAPPRVVVFSAYDITQEYADKVSAVLIKSRTDNQQLLDVISQTIAASMKGM